MGGNVSIGEVYADKIVMSVIDRAKLQYILLSFFVQLNDRFGEFSGSKLWGYNTYNADFLSGSSTHLFDDSITDSEFSRIKPVIGDIDVNIPKEHCSNLMKFLEKSEQERCVYHCDTEYVNLIGFKKTNQIVTLWHFENLNINIQIDFELATFVNGKVSEWSKFIHSSPWLDMKSGIKGVAHKYMLRALTAKDLELRKVVNSKGVVKDKLCSLLSFSCYGLRISHEGESFDVDSRHQEYYVEIKEREYYTDLREMFDLYFDREPEHGEERFLESFIGILGLVNRYYDAPERKKVADGFIHTLWGKGAQVLYRDDMKADRLEKERMVEFLTNSLGLPKDIGRLLKVDYYFG